MWSVRLRKRSRAGSCGLLESVEVLTSCSQDAALKRAATFRSTHKSPIRADSIPHCNG